MGWLGLDDTDTLAAGCTTFSLHHLLTQLPNHVEIGELRLVRLWPFAQQRTRGNAAVAVELNTSNVNDLIRFLDAHWASELQPLAGAITDTDEHKRLQSPTDPGMVWFEHLPVPSDFYLHAVRRHVRLDEVPEATRSWGGMGRIGATAAVLWPQRYITWEAIAWRQEKKWNTTERKVCEDALGQVSNLEGTFLTRDPRTQRSLISPRSTCPVLFGVRGRTEDSAALSASMLIEAESTEAVLSSRVFATNQASDDHLETMHTAEVSSIEILPRGTTAINTKAGVWMAFSESGDVKKLAQTLKPGDTIEGFGLAPEEGVLHLEKLRIAVKKTLLIRPTCPKCDRTMKSMGQGQGVRCPECKQRQEVGWDAAPSNEENGNWVQPPSDSRRHLAQPLEWKESIKHSDKPQNG